MDKAKERMKTWSDLKEISRIVKIPKGYKIEQLPDSRIDELVALIKEWYPDITVGSESCHLDPQYFRNETTVVGITPHRDIFPLIFTKDGEIRAFCTIKKIDDALAMTGRLGAVSPKSRNEGLGTLGVELSVAFGQLMGAGVVYHYATLRHLYSQKLLENLGFKAVGIVPAFDRDMVSKNVIKRVPEAIYAKVLVGKKDIFHPKKEHLTTETQALWTFLFGKN